jgi:hypothetical protein
MFCIGSPTPSCRSPSAARASRFSRGRTPVSRRVRRSGGLMPQPRASDVIAACPGSSNHRPTPTPPSSPPRRPSASAIGSSRTGLQEVIRRDNLIANVVVMGDLLRRRLDGRFGNNPSTSAAADSSARSNSSKTARLKGRSTPRSNCMLGSIEAMARGLVIYPLGGAIDGSSGDHVLLAPPFIVNESTPRRSSSFTRRGGRRGPGGPEIAGLRRKGVTERANWPAKRGAVGRMRYFPSGPIRPWGL